MAMITGKLVTYIPIKTLEGSHYLFNRFLPDEVTKQKKGVEKIRPPRFVSFTMELEPYSKKKAFALEILNDINLNVFETETIQKMYTLSSHVVIITAKRIICVDELGAKEERVKNKDTTSASYKHWNVFFKDIYKVVIDIVDKRTDHILSKSEMDEVFSKYKASLL